MLGWQSQVLALQFLQQQRLFRPAQSVKVSHCIPPENSLWITQSKTHIFVIKHQKSLLSLKINRLVLVVGLNHGTSEGLIGGDNRANIKSICWAVVVIFFSLVALLCRINELMIF